MVAAAPIPGKLSDEISDIHEEEAQAAFVTSQEVHAYSARVLLCACALPNLLPPAVVPSTFYYTHLPDYLPHHLLNHPPTPSPLTLSTLAARSRVRQREDKAAILQAMVYRRDGSGGLVGQATHLSHCESRRESRRQRKQYAHSLLRFVVGEYSARLALTSIDFVLLLMAPAHVQPL